MPRRKIINVSAETHDRWKERAAAAGMPLAKFIDSRIDGPIGAVTLDQAVEAIFKRLPNYAERIHECSRDSGFPPSLYILSQLALIQERGEASYINGDTIASQEEERRANIVDSTDRSICKWEPCKKSFNPEKRGQAYCSYECGVAARRAAMPKRSGSSQHEYAPPGRSEEQLTAYLKGLQG